MFQYCEYLNQTIMNSSKISKVLHIIFLQYLPQREFIKQSFDNIHDFDIINNNLDACGISVERKNHMYSILSAILNLGNIVFESNEDICYISEESQEILNNVAILLGIKKENLEDVLTHRTISVLNSKIRYVIFKITGIFSMFSEFL